MVLEKKKKHISIRKEFSEKIFTPACMANPNRLYHQYSRRGAKGLPYTTKNLERKKLPVQRLVLIQPIEAGTVTAKSQE